MQRVGTSEYFAYRCSCKVLAENIQGIRNDPPYQELILDLGIMHVLRERIPACVIDYFGNTFLLCHGVLAASDAILAQQIL